MSSAQNKLQWRRACGNAACVEVALADQVHVRNSQDPAGPRLVFAPQAWTSFVKGLREGSFE
jgi:hypothetical protein